MNLTTTIEALLFVAGGDVSVKELASQTGESEQDIQSALDELKEKYSDGSGIVLLSTGTKYRLATNPALSDLIAGYLHTEVTGELTRPQLETLTIIAYRGPISKPEIEMIRGVNCTLILRNLLMRGLVEEISGTLENTYQLTTEFLRLLGISNVKDLPQYDELSAPDLLERLTELEEARKASVQAIEEAQKQENES